MSKDFQNSDTYDYTYLKHSIAITVGKRSFKAGETRGIVLIEVKLVVAESRIFHFDFTVTLRYSYEATVLCFSP